MSQANKPDILDLVTRAAFSAYVDETESSQVAGLLEFFHTAASSGGDAYSLVVVYLARQVARRKFSYNAASYLVKVLNDLGGPGLDVGKAMHYLGLFRWIYDAVSQRRLRVQRGQIARMGFADFVKLYFR